MSEKFQIGDLPIQLPETAFEEPRRDRYPQVGQHPATPRQIPGAALRPLPTCGT